jgi:hypothetical protein
MMIQRWFNSEAEVLRGEGAISNVVALRLSNQLSANNEALVLAPLKNRVEPPLIAVNEVVTLPWPPWLVWVVVFQRPYRRLVR